MKEKYFLPILLSIFLLSISFRVTAGITNTNNNSLSISSNQSQNKYQYLIEIDITGVDTSKVTFEIEYQTLYLLAYRGSVISEVDISGGQVMRLAYDFPTDAVLKNYFRIDHPNKIIISIPKA